MKKKKYASPEVLYVLSSVDCLTTSGGGYDNVIEDVDWDNFNRETTL